MVWLGIGLLYLVYIMVNQATYDFHFMAKKPIDILSIFWRLKWADCGFFGVVSYRLADLTVLFTFYADYLKFSPKILSRPTLGSKT